MNSSDRIEKVISFFLFAGLFLNLFFLYFAQERLFSRTMTGNLALGPERYLRILSVIFIFMTVVLTLLFSRFKYHHSIYLAYGILLTYISLNYIFSGASLFDMTEFMDQKGLGTWICMGLIFVSYNDRRYLQFRKFAVFSVFFIAALSVYNLIDFGIGLWRGQALSKYQVYAVNLVWLAPYTFLMLKHNKKLKVLRVFALGFGIILALITQTRSFLIIYFLAILFDFITTKNKRTYTVFLILGFVGMLVLILKTKMLSTSFNLLVSRGIEDSRSDQLAAFLSQLSFVELITGEGFYAYYRMGNRMWTGVDNQWLYLLWWAGLLPVLTYFYLSAVVPFKFMIQTKLDYETKAELFVLFIWVLALTGLAIYTTMSVDFFFFVVCIILGRILYKFTLANPR